MGAKLVRIDSRVVGPLDLTQRVLGLFAMTQRALDSLRTSSRRQQTACQLCLESSSNRGSVRWVARGKMPPVGGLPCLYPGVVRGPGHLPQSRLLLSPGPSVSVFALLLDFLDAGYIHAE